MSRRIETGLSSRLNPFGPDWSGVKSAQNSQSIGDQVQDSLFGKPKPPLVNPEDYTDLDELMAKLNSYRRKFSIMSGESENEYKF